jgi:hypothetical protein
MDQEKNLNLQPEMKKGRNNTSKQTDYAKGYVPAGCTNK